ncbi:MAG: hypothetical protein ACI9O6_003192 [Glaciecola sp.]|jgi:hypothetical protein
MSLKISDVIKHANRYFFHLYLSFDFTQSLDDFKHALQTKKQLFLNKLLTILYPAIYCMNKHV